MTDSFAKCAAIIIELCAFPTYTPYPLVCVIPKTPSNHFIAAL